MYFLVIAVHPKPTNDEYGVTDGAFAATWVQAISESEAERKARAFLEMGGWDTDVVDIPPREVSRAEFVNDAAKLALFDQALVDDIVTTLHLYPAGADEE
jgi:hypothetical protein